MNRKPNILDFARDQCLPGWPGPSIESSKASYDSPRLSARCVLFLLYIAILQHINLDDSQQNGSTILNHPGLVANADSLPLLGVIRPKASTSNNCFRKLLSY